MNVGFSTNNPFIDSVNTLHKHIQLSSKNEKDAYIDWVVDSDKVRLF